jgi:hypothetical protein
MPADHLSGAVRDGSIDRVALNLFDQLRDMTVCDRRFVFVELDGRLLGASSERIVLARFAVHLFEQETTDALSRRDYQRWRMGRSDAHVLPSARQIENTWNGSWATAMDRLGFRAGAVHEVRSLAGQGVDPNPTDLLQHLRACASELSRTPSLCEFELWRSSQLRGRSVVVVFGVQVYQRRFGGWRNAIAAAGLPQRARKPPTPVLEWTREDAIGCLRDAAAGRSTERLRMAQSNAWRGERLDPAGLRCQGRLKMHPSAPVENAPPCGAGRKLGHRCGRAGAAEPRP